MDSRFRNRGALKLGIGALLFIALFVIVWLRGYLSRRHLSQNEQLIAVLFYLAIAWFGIWGCIDLAKAKGHGSEIVAFIVVAGCCLCPIFYVVMPFIILFALDDRLPQRSYHRHR